MAGEYLTPCLADSQAQTINVRALKCFISIYITGSFSATAKLLHITTSTVSYHITNLENNFGQKLFSRGGHWKNIITNTSFGSAIYKNCKRIVFLSEELKFDRVKIESLEFIVCLCFLKGINKVARIKNKNVGYAIGHLNYLETIHGDKIFHRWSHGVRLYFYKRNVFKKAIEIIHLSNNIVSISRSFCSNQHNDMS